MKKGFRQHEANGDELNPSPIVETIIGCAIEVHRNLGPGLLESAYSPALTYEWQNAGLDFRRDVAVPVEYKGLHLSCGSRVDYVVAGLMESGAS